MSINCDSSLWCIGGEAECGHSLNCLPSLIFHLHEVDAPIPSNFRWEQRQNKLQMVGSLGWRANNRKVEDWGHIGALIPICLMAEPSCAWYALRKKNVSLKCLQVISYRRNAFLLQWWDKHKCLHIKSCKWGWSLRRGGIYDYEN